MLKWDTRLTQPGRLGVVAQYDYASGTANPNGSSNQTFDTLFGAADLNTLLREFSARSFDPTSALRVFAFTSSHIPQER